jgi:flagellar hook-associated protein 3 FlgL
LGSGNHAGVRNDIGGIDTQMYNLLKVRADIGARQNRLELTSDRLSNDNINFTQLMADNEDVDTAETIMNLKNEENVYRASLSGGARIIQPTLVDFLR